jgi:hypothetical protein
VRKPGVIATVLALAALLAWSAGAPALAANGGAAGAAGAAGAGAAGAGAAGAQLLPQVQPPPPPPPTSGPGSRIEPDPAAYQACEDGSGPLWTPYYTDRFHSCFLVHTGFDVVVDGAVVGNWTLQWIVTGSADNDAQLMTFKVKSTLWKVTGTPPKPTWEWSVGLACLNYFGDASCSQTHAAGYTYDVAVWSLPHSFTFLFNTSKSKGGGDKYHSAADALNYHAMSQWQGFPANTRSWSNGVYFRCDKASYINSFNGGCIYYQAMATWKVSLSGKAAAVARHIQLAQAKPGTGTYPPAPGGKKVVIPGFKSTGQPLMRLLPAYNEKIYNGNRSTAVAACVKKWGKGYSQGGKFQCDEYPMAATYEGASQANGSPWWYSVQVLATAANQSAGGSWSAFLKSNRILSGDPFWVQVVP